MVKYSANQCEPGSLCALVASWSLFGRAQVAQRRRANGAGEISTEVRIIGYKSAAKHTEYTRADISANGARGNTKTAHQIALVRFSLRFTPSQAAARYTRAPAALPFQRLAIPQAAHCIRCRPARRDLLRSTQRSCRCLLRPCRTA